MAIREFVIQEWMSLSGATAGDLVKMPVSEWFDTLGIGRGVQIVMQVLTYKNVDFDVMTAPRFDGPGYALKRCNGDGFTSHQADLATGISRPAFGSVAPLHRFVYWQLVSNNANWEIVFRITVRVDTSAMDAEAPATRGSFPAQPDWVRFVASTDVSEIIEDSGSWINTAGVDRLVLDLTVLQLVNAKLLLEAANVAEGYWTVVREVVIPPVVLPLTEAYVLTRDNGATQAGMLRGVLRWRAVKVAVGVWEATFRKTYIA